MKLMEKVFQLKQLDIMQVVSMHLVMMEELMCLSIHILLILGVMEIQCQEESIGVLILKPIQMLI